MFCVLLVQVLQLSGTQVATQLQWHLGAMLADASSELSAIAEELRRPLFSLVGGWHRSSGARLAAQPTMSGQPQQLSAGLSQLEALGHTAATLAAAGRLAPQVYAEAPELVMQALTGLAGVQEVSLQVQVKLAPVALRVAFLMSGQPTKRPGGAHALRMRPEAALAVPAMFELPGRASP